MSLLHKEILTKAQQELLPIIGKFKSDFGLVGGTAVALQIGHRESIDFDLFTKTTEADFSIPSLKRKFGGGEFIGQLLRDSGDELTFITTNGVKITFYNFPFEIPYSIPFEQIIEMPDLLTLAAMKAFALGRRAKWKDYVDLYFIMKDFHGLQEISTKAMELFGNEFNEKLLRTHLAYFDDINYSEPIVYREGYEVPDEMVKNALLEASLK